MPYHQQSTPPVYPEQIYEWQEDDDVQGGTGGDANVPIQQIVERTNWLKYYLGLAQTAILALQGAFAGLLVRVSSLETLLTPERVNNITNINDALLLTAGTLANARLNPELRNAVKIQTVTVRPEDVSLTIDLELGGIVIVELQNTAPCAIAFQNWTAGLSGEIHFSSIFGANRVVQMPASLPRVEVAAPDTRNLTVGTKTCAFSYRVLPSNLFRATFIRDFA